MPAAFPSDSRRRAAETGPDSRRIVALDTLRGLTILSMVAFHAMYDLAYLYGMDLPWFTGTPFQAAWRISISGTFLLLAGWMTSLSRNNLRRAVLYAVAAGTVWAATTVAAVDTPVNFGILFCMAASTAIWWALERLAARRCDGLPCIAFILLAAASLAAALVLWDVPHRVYAFPGLAWLGFPYAGFASGDYYPLVPFGFLYLAGALAAAAWKRSGAAYPAWMMGDPLPPLAFVGRHSLIVYLLHQPIILGALALAMGS